MIIYLAELRPALSSNGAEQVLRFSSNPSWTRADGVDWSPMLAVPYRRSTQVFDGAFQTQPQDYGQLEFAVSKGQSIAPLTAMVWDGRPVRIWRGQKGQNTSQMTLVFDGLAESAFGRRSRVTVKLRGPNVNVPLLPTVYAGTGGAEGPSELKNSVKPMLLGAAMNVEPVYINRALGIFQYHSYGPAAGVAAVYDSGSQLGTSIGDFPNYAALAAATIPAGRYATCNAAGLGRHGGEITGILTIDAVGAVSSGLPGSILKWILRTHLGLPSSKVKEDSLDWLDAQLPYPQDIYVNEQIDSEEFCRQFMLSLGGYVWWTDSGMFTVGLVRRGHAPIATIDRLNIQDTPQLRDTSPPVWKRTQGWGRSWRVHSYSEVRTPKELNPRGTWTGSPNPAYQYYDMVDWANATWVYINSVSGSTAAPGTDANVWQLFRENGAPVVDSTTTPPDPVPGLLWRNPTNGQLRAYIGGQWLLVSDVTGQNVAAAITNQSPWATTILEIDKLAKPGVNVFPYPFAPLAPRTPSQIGWGNAGAPDASFTHLGTTNGPWSRGNNAYVQQRMTGGGAFTTFPFFQMPWTAGRQTSVSLSGYGSNATFYPYIEFIAGDGGTIIGSAALLYNSTTDRYEVNGAMSPANTAFLRVVCSGQYPASGSYQDMVWWGIKVEQGPQATGLSDTSTVRVDATYVEYWNGLTLEQLRPGEINANVTESRVAAAINNQGGLATKNSVAWAAELTNKPAFVTDVTNHMGFDRINPWYVLNPADYSFLGDRWAAEGGANVTENRTAAAIANQGALATRNNVDLGVHATGLLPVNLADSGLRNNAITVNLLDGTLNGIGTGGVQVWNDLLVPSINTAGTTAVWNSITGTGKPENFADVTAGRTAAAIANQSAWATFNQLAPGAVVNPTFNLISDPGLRLNGKEWNLPSGWSVGQGSDVGNYALNGTNTANMRVGKRVGIYPNQTYTFSVKNGGAGYSGTAILQLNWYTAAGTFISQVTAGGTAQNLGYQISQATGTAPSNAAFAECFVQSPGGFSGGGFYIVFEPKLELGGSRTVWRDDNTSGALYNTGADIDTLRPGEFGANVTEGRVAAAIANQGGLATKNNVAFSSEITGRPEYMLNVVDVGGIARLNSWYMRNPNDGSLLTERWAAEAGANITENRTAAFIANQAAWATLGVTTNRVSRLQDDGAMRAQDVWNPSVGAILSDRWPDEGGANRTQNHAAAAIINQAPWATANDLPIAKLTQARPNWFPYPFAPTDGRSPAQIGWQNTTISGGSLVSVRSPWLDGDGYVFARSNGGAPATQFPFYDVPWEAGVPTSFGMNAYGSITHIYVEFLNSARNTVLSSAVATFNSLTQRHEFNNVTSPTGTAWARVVLRLDFASSGSYQDAVWWAIKLERGPNATPIGDSSQVRTLSNYVEYPTGQNLNDLRPGEFGANVTESRTAAAIANQGTLATRSSVNFASELTNRPAFMTDVVNVGGADRVNSWYVRNPNDGTYLTERWAAELGANVTESRTAAAIANQGQLATQNQARASQLLIGGFDNIIPDANYQDRNFWGIQNAGGAAGFYDLDNNWWQDRGIFMETPTDFDYSSQYFDVEVGATYRVRARIWNNNTAAGWSGAFWPMIHIPNQAWFGLHNGQSVNPDVANAANAIVANGDTLGTQDFYFTVINHAAARIQFRFKSNARGSGIIMNIQITKVPRLGRDLINPGTNNAYGTAEIQTNQGTAAAIAGQGDLATRNSATLPFGLGNLVVNSDFVNSTFGWVPGWDGTVGGTVNRGINLTNWWGQINVLYAYRPGVPTPGTVFDAYIISFDGGMDGTRRFAVPVLPGERIYYSWLLGPHRCNGHANIGFYDGSGSYISEAAGSLVNDNGGAGGGNPATMGRSEGFATVPANARYARIWARAVVSGADSPYLFCAQPFMTKVPSNQTASVPYSSGPSDRAADRTIDQPVVSQLNPSNGRTNSRRALSQIMTSGVLQLLDVPPITAITDRSNVSTITINAHTVYDDAGTISFSSGSIGGLMGSTLYYVYEFNPDFVGGARSYVATTNRAAITEFGRRFVGFVTTPAPDGPPAGGGGGGGGGPPGGGEIP